MQAARHSLGLALAAMVIVGCTGTLDVEVARRWLDRPKAPTLPDFFETSESTLPALESLRATDGALRSIPLRWDPILAGEVGGYVVERAESPDGPFTKIAAIAEPSRTVWTDHGPAEWSGGGTVSEREQIGDGESLYYRVRVFSTTGELATAVSDTVKATTAVPPAPPEGLRAYSHQPRAVPLSWRASEAPYVAGYAIERSPSSGGPFEPLAQVTGLHQTIYLDSGLGDLRVFYYRVLSINTAGGRGAPSAPVRAMTKPDPLPPFGLHLLSQELGRNELGWLPNVETDLVGYRLLRIRNEASEAEVVATLSSETTRGKDTEVAADEVVAYRLIALDHDGLASNRSAPVRVESLGYQLRAQATRNGVRLSWNRRADEGFTGTRVYLHGALGQSELAFVDGDEFVHQDIQPGNRYRYSVVLERPDASRGPASAPVVVTVP